MKRISLIPYDDISLLSLASVTPGTKFRLFSKIKEITKDKIVFFDDQNEHSFTHSTEPFEGIKKDDVIKEESSLKIEKILQMNLDWALLTKVQDLERM